MRESGQLGEQKPHRRRLFVALLASGLFVLAALSLLFVSAGGTALLSSLPFVVITWFELYEFGGHLRLRWRSIRKSSWSVWYGRLASLFQLSVSTYILLALPKGLALYLV